MRRVVVGFALLVAAVLVLFGVQELETPRGTPPRSLSKNDDFHAAGPSSGETVASLAEPRGAETADPVSGKVTAKDGGRPIAGATVVLSRLVHEGGRPWPTQGETLAATTTGPDGRFRLPCVRSGNAILSVSARGFMPQAIEMSGSGEWTFVLEAGVATIFTIVDEDGAPIPTARVVVVGWKPDEPATVFPADKNGRAQLWLRQGSEPFVRAPGYAEVQVRRSIAPEMKIVLHRGFGLAGHVVGEDGDAIAGARVTLADGSLPTRVVRTDESGSFSFSELPAESLTLFASKGGYARAIAFWRTGDLHVTIVLHPPRPPVRPKPVARPKPKPNSYARVQVLSVEGKPVSGVALWCGYGLATPVSGTDGVAVIPLRAAPGREVTVTTSGAKPYDGSVQLAAQSGPAGPVVPLRLPRGVRFAIVAEDGKGSPRPEGDVSIRTYGAVSRVPGEGSTLFVGAAGAEITVEVGAKGFLTRSEKVQIPGTDGGSISIRLARAAAIDGVVDDGDGSRPAWLSALLTVAGGVNNWGGEVFSDGTFRIDGLPAGEHTLYLSEENGIPGVRLDVTLRAGETFSLGSLRLARPTALQGRVLDAEGKPVGGAHVVVANTQLNIPDTSSHGDGTYRIDVPSFLKGALLVSHPGLGTRIVDFDGAGTTDLGDVALPPEGRVRFIVKKASPVGYGWGVRAPGHSWSWQPSNGSNPMKGLAPGPLFVRMDWSDGHGKGGVVEHRVVVEAGKTIDVEFDLP